MGASTTNSLIISVIKSPASCLRGINEHLTVFIDSLLYHSIIRRVRDDRVKLNDYLLRLYLI